MRLSRISLVQLPAASQQAARIAAREAFPETEIVEFATLEAALARDAGRHPELLVLGGLDEASASAAVQALDAGGQPRWAVVFLDGECRDIADTVPPEEWNPPALARAFRSAVLQHELLCENLRLRGDLKTVARRIRHDLFTPVGCVTTSAHVLDLLAPDDKETAATMIENIKVSSQEISTLIERISFVLRASAESPVPGPIDMQAVVTSVLKQLDPEIRKAGATVSSATNWPEIDGVGSWLHVIWWNLVDNALKHGGPAAQVQLAWEEEGDGYRFSTIDHGPGIPASREATLFRPFEQLHDQPAPGLGLSFVQRLVQLQGGSCRYSRGDDGTSIFSFTLPRPAQH